MAGEPLFSVTNVHPEELGTPPQVHQEPNHYQGYFENRYGEQWVFVFDHAENQDYLRGGDTPVAPAQRGGAVVAEGLRPGCPASENQLRT